MTRQSTVALHPQITRINTMLDDGVPYSVIAREMGLATSSVGRWAIARKSELSKLIDGEPTTTDVISRILEAADHARDARRQARLTGSPAHQARMIKAESDVLTKLIDELGVTDTSVAEYMAEAETFTKAVQVMIRQDRRAGLALLNAVDQFPELAPFGKTLATFLGVSR
jgi:transposase-like protein